MSVPKTGYERVCSIKITVYSKGNPLIAKYRFDYINVHNLVVLLTYIETGRTRNDHLRRTNLNSHETRILIKVI